ncbi:MAG TPA: sigma-70 family RNA polymerase sigma factor [Deltaproteobacteria bacterium]|nr:sigma-70 family RNA polymerase sigma factor [Deltaproteobacteria bacterium]
MSAIHPTASDDPDAELVRACQAGGPEAERSFALLVDRHAGRIRRRAARILGSESEAEDVTQEVFVNVLRFLDRYRPDRPFGHWLSVVTLNACRVALRRRASRERRHEAFRTDPGHDSATEMAGDPLLREWLGRALDELPPLTRDCIRLRAIEGWTYRAIAKRHGLTVPATKMRVLRALRDLRGRYELQARRNAPPPRHTGAPAAPGPRIRAA